MRKFAIGMLAIPVGIVFVLWVIGVVLAFLHNLAGAASQVVTGADHVFAVMRLVLIAGIVGLALFGVGAVLWRCSFPRRAHLVMCQLAKGKDEDRPRLRWMWKRGPVWDVAWAMPLGLTTSKLLQNKEAIEEKLDCSVTFWYRLGMVWMRAGTARLPDRVTYDDFHGRQAPAGELVFGVGMGRTGRVWADLAELPHLLVGGRTGGGKSVFLRQLLVSLAERYDRDRLRLALIDLRGGVEFRFMRTLPQLWAPVASIPESAEDLVQRLNAELDRRQAALEAEGVENITRWNERRPDDRWPRIVVVLDEMAELSAAEAPRGEERERRQKILADLSRLCRLGRASGLHVIACTQRPDKDAVPGQIKANIPATVAFQVRARVNSEILLGETNYAAAALPPWAGRGIWQWDGETHMQTPLLERDEAERRVAAVAFGPAALRVVPDEQKRAEPTEGEQAA